MLLPLAYMAAPKVFIEAVDHRLSGTQLQVVDWWADDLDGDKVTESIAAVCDQTQGFYLVQHGKDLLEAPMEIDGRNNCGTPNRPPWTTRTSHEIVDNINVHHGSVSYAYAIRDNKLVLIREESHGFDVTGPNTQESEDDVTDYDNLTWTRKRDPGSTEHGIQLLAAAHAHRSATIAGKTTVGATTKDDKLTLHVHADRALTLRFCEASPCDTIKVDKGDHDVDIEYPEFEIAASGGTYKIHIERSDADQAYLPPRAPW